MPRVVNLRIPLLPVPRASSPFSSIVLLAYCFGALIILGAGLLMLPMSSNSGDFTSPVNAFFTAASAVCVTGLVVVDTGTYWSTFGQGVLLGLFQIGGLGFITLATILLLAVNRHFGLKERLALSEAIGVDRLKGTLGLITRIAVFSLVVEAAGTAVFYFCGLVEGNGGEVLWASVFHAVSAFNNCGMDILGEFRSLTGHQDNTVVLLMTALLVIIGSTGYVIIMNVFRNWSFHKLTLDTKIVLLTTLTLLVLGTLFFLGVEYSNPATLGSLPFPQKLLMAFFQSVTPRTAGFAAIDINSFKEISLFFMMFLMFIGGAVGSTAGGIKVNTLGALAITLYNVIRGKIHIEAFGRQISQETIYRALTLFLVYLGTVAVIIIALSFSEKIPLDRILFETFSALSTVGLTNNVTPDLSTVGRIIITVAMFLGRLGPLALIVYLAHRHQSNNMEYPHENIRLG